MLASGGHSKFGDKSGSLFDAGRLRIVEAAKSSLHPSDLHNEQIYLDYQATTPVDPRVLQAMLPCFRKEFGNPHSTFHGYGRRAGNAIRRAFADIADAVGALPEDIVVTSGATEANNLALNGMAGGSLRFISLETEHPSVLGPLSQLASRGFVITVLPVGADGIVDLDRLGEELAIGPALVSIAAANNEIGVLQPLADIAELTLLNCADGTVAYCTRTPPKPSAKSRSTCAAWVLICLHSPGTKFTDLRASAHWWRPPSAAAC
jgi:hypothetical protein